MLKLVSPLHPVRAGALSLSLALLLGTSWSSATHAQATSTTAEALFRAGRKAMQEADHARALSTLRESYRLDPAPGTLLNIAVCEEALGALADAWRHYQEIVHAIAADDRRAVIAQSKLEALEPRLPLLTVNAERGAPADTHVAIGSEVDVGPASFGLPLPMNPGSYELVARAEGHADRRYAIELPEGARVQLDVAPGPRSEPSPPPPSAADAAALAPAEADQPATQPAPSPRSAAAPAGGSRPVASASGSSSQVPSAAHARTAVSYALLGAASVALVSAAVTGGFALHRAGVVDDHCRGSVCDDAGFAAASEGDVLFAVSVVSLVLAAATGAIGGYLLVSEPANAPAKGGGVRFTARGPAPGLRFVF